MKHIPLPKQIVDAVIDELMKEGTTFYILGLVSDDVVNDMRVKLEQVVGDLIEQSNFTVCV